MKKIIPGTTEMFRDPLVWIELKRIIPLVIKGDFFRICHVGCSTGEEVFSMLILLEEIGFLDKAKIIAFDINQESIGDLGMGICNKVNSDFFDINYKRYGGGKNFRDFFKKGENGIIFNPFLLGKVQFYSWDLFNGDFGEYDIIFCRNILTYYNGELRDKAWGIFYESLNKGGLLVLGFTSIKMDNRFKVFNEKLNIYIRD